MPILQGLITGTLGYDLKKEFFSNSFMFREVETYNYEIYSVDFLNSTAQQIQNQIQAQFSQVYSGDIRVKVFNTQNTFQFPSDSIKAAKYNVSVEIKKPVVNLSGQFPELTGNFYSGIDYNFWTNYGQYILDFKEDFGFSTKDNGNREFSHNIGFGLQTGWSGDNSVTGRKIYAQNIASGIFGNDQNTPYGLSTMVKEITGLGNNTVFRNYYNESYDLLRNVYTFSRKREELPFSDTNIVFNLSNSLNLNSEGMIEVSEKASTLGKIDYNLAKNNLETYYANSYSRCSSFYNSFYNMSVILQDGQYSGNGLNNSNLLPLINTPIKLVKFYDTNSMAANYDVTYTNNPTFSGDGTVTSQTIQFDINPYNLVEATHTFDYTLNRIINNSGYYTTLFANTTGSSKATVSNYYSTYFAGSNNAYNSFPNLNLTKVNAEFPNIKTRTSVKFTYSNNPTYFVNINGITFNVIDSNVEIKKPTDIVNEYKIVNRPTNKSILSYAYQSEKGEISINVKATLGKQHNVFSPDGVGSFGILVDNGLSGYTLLALLQALYKYAGQIFLNQFNYPIVAFNWFISDSKYSFNSDGGLTVQLNYCYTLKKRNAANYP